MQQADKAGHRIFLIGMPGAGKSYWGQKVAEYLDREFVDLDAYIALREGRSVQELIMDGGEESFREKENRYLVELVPATGKNTVIACGGGTPCSSDNIRLMKINGVVIYLEAGIDYLVHNIMGDETVRPLLAGQEALADRLEVTYRARRHYYEQAHYILQVADISVPKFAEILGYE